MAQHKVSFQEIIEALNANNENSGGSYIEKKSKCLLRKNGRHDDESR